MSSLLKYGEAMIRLMSSVEFGQDLSIRLINTILTILLEFASVSTNPKIFWSIMNKSLQRMCITAIIIRPVVLVPLSRMRHATCLQ